MCNCSGNLSETVYNLPDGGTVLIGNEARQAAELMFDPSPICGEEMSITDLILNSVQNTEIDQKYMFYNNVVLGGGNTLITNFVDRLQETMNATLSDTPPMKCKLVAPPDREMSVWIGGSILTSLSTFQERWISYKEYEEFGPAIIYRKPSS